MTSCKFPQNTPSTAYRKGCRCGSCAAVAKMRRRSNYVTNKEKEQAAQAKYRASHKKQIEAQRASTRGQRMAYNKVYYAENRDKMLRRAAEYRSSPFGAYLRQKNHAKRRNISWEITFNEWWIFWCMSFRWNKRGTFGSQYCMARHGDTGPYKLKNVKIITNSENSLEISTNNKKKISS